MRDCAVCECDPSEIPVCWQKDDWLQEQLAAAAAAAAASSGGQSRTRPGSVVSLLDEGAAESEEEAEAVAVLSRVEFEGGANGNISVPAPGRAAGAAPSIPGWQLGKPAARSPQGKQPQQRPHSPKRGRGGDVPPADADVWMEEDEASPDLKYVNLLKNPEGYTGWAGPSAFRIWRSVYEENCFTTPLSDMCYQERVFYRLISGLQTSINTHIAMTFNDGQGIVGGTDLYTSEDSAAADAEPVGDDDGDGAEDGDRAAVNTRAAAQPAARSSGSSPLWRSTLANLRARVASWLGLPAQAVTHATATRSRLLSPSVRTAGRPSDGVATAEDGGHEHPQGSDSGVHAATPPAQLVLSPGIAPSVPMYVERIGRFPDRLQNLYFVYLFAARALARARPLLLSLDFNTGDAAADAETRALVAALYERTGSLLALQAGFDERTLFAAEEGGAGAQSVLADLAALSAGVAEGGAFAPDEDDNAGAAAVLSAAGPAGGCATKAASRQAGSGSGGSGGVNIASESQSVRDDLADLLRRQGEAEGDANRRAAAAEPQASASQGLNGVPVLPAPPGFAGAGHPPPTPLRTALAVETSDTVAAAQVTTTGAAAAVAAGSKQTQGTQKGAGAAAGRAAGGAGALLGARAPAAGGLSGVTPTGRAALREMWRDKYRNISRIMDCIGCEKCRLWGKLQFLGLGTAMKVMFASEAGLQRLRLSRNEVVAFVNVLHRLSMSVAAVGVFRELEAERKLQPLIALVTAAVGAAVLAVLWWVAGRCCLSGNRNSGEGGGKLSPRQVQGNDANGVADTGRDGAGRADAADCAAPRKGSGAALDSDRSAGDHAARPAQPAVHRRAR
jgi:hypothetical protein